MSGPLFQECGILLEGFLGIFSKGQLSCSLFSYTVQLSEHAFSQICLVILAQYQQTSP